MFHCSFIEVTLKSCEIILASSNGLCCECFYNGFGGIDDSFIVQLLSQHCIQLVLRCKNACYKLAQNHSNANVMDKILHILCCCSFLYNSSSIVEGKQKKNRSKEMAEEKKSSHILRHFKRMSKDGWLAAEKPPNKYLKNKMIATVGVAAHVALASNSMDQKLDNAFVGAVDRIVMATDFIMRWHPIRHFIYQICPTDVCWWLSVAPMYTTGWHRYKDGTRPFDECSVTVWCHRTNFAFILLILIW